MEKNFFLLYLFLAAFLLPSGAMAAGNLSVTSTPSAANIYVDDVIRGVTPSVIEDLISGPHMVTLQKTGYQNYSAPVTVLNNQTSTVSAVLIPLSPAISTITPAYGFNTGVVSITDLSGTGFSGGATVLLMKAGQANVTATSISVTATRITCNLDLTGKTAGFWDVVVQNPGGQSAVHSGGFEIRAPSAALTLSSITPDYGVNNEIVTITGLAGTGFLSGSAIRLQKSGYNDIPGTVTSVVSHTKITGTFDLTGRTPGSYVVCVENSATDSVCGLVFTVYSSDASFNGTIAVESHPSAASVFVGSDYKGKTPLTVYNLTPGKYTVLVQKAGYDDWSDRITVTAGNRSYVYARLIADEPALTTVTTARTITMQRTAPVISTVKVPTSWPSAPSTPESSLNILAIIGAISLGILVLRKP